MSGNLNCSNSNIDDDGSIVTSFHDANYCPGPDLQHNWQGAHGEANFSDPANALLSTLNDGFVLVNDATEQIDGTESPTDDDTMGYYNQDDLSFYYQLAQTFAIDDRYFCSVVGPTFPNRSYEMAATSFGHVTTNEIFPPGIDPANPSPLNTSIGYQPITGSIFDLLDASNVTWFNYFADLPTSVIFPRQPRSIPCGACPLGVWRQPLRRPEFHGCRCGRYFAFRYRSSIPRLLPIKT